MRFFFDTEFMEDGRTIELLSIAVVSEDGREYYAEFEEADLSLANPWVKDNVIPHLRGNTKPSFLIAEEVRAFVGEKPEFWAYYAAYDWVALCQLFGTMMQIPKGWPHRCNDLAQLAAAKGIEISQSDTDDEHFALADARWCRMTWLRLNAHG